MREITECLCKLLDMHVRGFLYRLMFYAAGAMLFAIVVIFQVGIPCLWKLATGVPSPGCGLTRAFVLATNLDFLGAIRLNILFLPIVASLLAYLTCDFIDIFWRKGAVSRLNRLAGSKWVIGLAVLLMALSWYYNIVRGI